LGHKEVPVTHLRKIMLEELQRRNYAQHTTRSYIRAVEDFARHFNCSPDRLGPRHIREYQAELFEKRKLSAGSVAVRLAALRFFYCKTCPAQPVGATPSNQLIRRYFPRRTDLSGCARSKPSQGSVPADLTQRASLAFVFMAM